MGKKLSIFRTKDVQAADSPTIRSENTTGPEKWFNEEERVLVGWLTLRMLPEEPKMGSDMKLSPKPNQETEVNSNFIFNNMNPIQTHNDGEQFKMLHEGFI